jgi:hypothetical protein
LVIVIAAALAAALVASATHTVRVDVTPTHVLNSFDPLRSIGAGIDSQNNGAVKNIYVPRTVKEMLSSGMGPVSYRLYTELSVQHWHWNPNGKWSDPRGFGYWTGSSHLGSQIRDSYGYRLPHRGFTNDQGNNDDFSRLTDGDPTSYWKSDPYLASAFTQEADTLHPQWVVVDLGLRKPIDAVRIHWSNPYAVDYRVEYWHGDDAINNPSGGTWVAFPGGIVKGGTGNTVVLRLSELPKSVEFVRVLMTISSHTCDSHGRNDLRNCVGYAIAEVDLGTIGSGGAFHDVVNHRPDNRQTVTYASSVDPWHAPANRVRDQEQAGLDLVFRSGLTRGLPTMVAVGMLYGTPADAAAEIAYLEARRDPISVVELGEEPDGQFILPEDYGALYLQWAHAIHAVDPSLRLGGPVFQGGTQDVQVWPNAAGDVSWLRRFLKYLSAHAALADLKFMSFEHYPFDPCDPSIAQDLLDEPAAIRGIMRTWIADGLPRGVPMFVTETNFSANSAEVMQDISGALWLADFEGSFLANGGSGTFLYQYEPEPLVSSSGQCTSWGAWGMFAGDAGNRIKQPTSQYFAARLVTQHWVQPIDAVDHVYPARSDITNRAGKNVVTAYALTRPDGLWSVMLVNKDPAKSYAVTVTFSDQSTGKRFYFADPVTTVEFGPAQYVWHRGRANGYANPDGPPLSRTQTGGAGAKYVLPAASITVLRGAIKP